MTAWIARTVSTFNLYDSMKAGCMDARSASRRDSFSGRSRRPLALTAAKSVFTARSGQA